MNRSNKGANTNIIQMVEDIFVLLLVYLIERKIFEDVIGKETSLKCLALVVVFCAIYILANKEARIYNFTLFFYMDRFWRIISKSWFLAAVITMGLMYVYNPKGDVRNFHLHFLLVTYIAICINMVISRFIQMMLNNYQAPRAAFVGTFEEYEKFHYFLNKTSLKINELGYILEGDIPENKVFNVIGRLTELENVIRQNELDQVYFIRHSDDNISMIQQYIDVCLEMGVTVKVVMDVSYSRQMYSSNSYVSSVGTFPVITYHTVALNSYEQFIKRLLDIIISAFFCILFSPVMLIAIIYIKLNKKGPVLLRLKRIGLNGRHFYLYKFAYISGLISNFPQLFNVIKGDMSLVGTRPPTVSEADAYGRNQWRRISIKPGVTGLWKIEEGRGEKSLEEKLELDLRYIDNWTLWADILIFFETMGTFLRKKA
ncbi:MAG: sugar transferase [Butyrivibrio sp.]|nr:sugar transferase [Butyrivibrio sp.]